MILLGTLPVEAVSGVCAGTAGVVVGHCDTTVTPGQSGQSLVTVRTLFVPIGMAGKTG